jgi:hypothetical protein
MSLYHGKLWPCAFQDEQAGPFRIMAAPEPPRPVIWSACVPLNALAIIWHFPQARSETPVSFPRYTGNRSHDNGGLRPRLLQDQVQDAAAQLQEQWQPTRKTFASLYGDCAALQRIEQIATERCRRAINE